MCVGPGCTHTLPALRCAHTQIPALGPPGPDRETSHLPPAPGTAAPGSRKGHGPWGSHC